MELLRKLLFLPEGASTFANRVDILHLFIISVTMIAAFGITAVALFFFVRYRRRSDEQLTPPIKPMLAVEALFVLVPLTFFLLWFALSFRDFVWMRSPPKNATDVYVMGKQWMWKFSYPDGPNAISVLRIPAGRPVRFLVTSQDVIHSFFIPEFRIKTDALPGRYTEAWVEATKPGLYQILCTEYCGLNHSTMRGQVVVMEPTEYDRWMGEQRRGLVRKLDADPVGGEPVLAGSSMKVQGEKAATELGCFKCHTVNGERHIGTSWLGLYGRRTRLSNGETIVADEAYLTRSMMDPLEQLVAGYQPVMPSYQGRMNAAQSAAIVEYIKALTTDRVVSESAKGPVYEPIRGQ